MFCSKLFVVNHNTVLAICDEELIGKKIKGKNVEVEVSKEFYGEKIIKDEETAIKLINDCTIGNLIGKRIVALAKKHGFITEENIIFIGDIPHAQFVKR